MLQNEESNCESCQLRDARSGGVPKLGVLFGRPHNKHYSILGFIWGPPIYGNCHVMEGVEGLEECRFAAVVSA